MSTLESTETFTQEHVKLLKDALGFSDYVIDGKVDVLKDQLILYFRNPVSKEVHAIDFPEEPTTNLTPLLEACSPAAFGLGNKDVLDPSYRKALKLNVMDFAIHFSPERLGILDEVALKLGNSLSKATREPPSVYAELYKLNCYVEGDFFKAHRDTPRATNMLGSLVINLPTVFSGGELVVRGEDGTEHVYDWSQSEATSVCSWAAFYSDMEHEIYPVKSGHRITLTYNIYFRDTKTAPVALSDLQYHPFYATLDRLVNHDPTFLRSGGVIIAHLGHHYPTYSSDVCSGDSVDLAKYLKGNDNSLFQIAQALGLVPRAKALVRDDSYVYTVLQNVTPFADFDERRGPNMESALIKSISAENGDFISHCDGPGNVTWSDRVVFLDNALGGRMLWKQDYVRYGNDASIGLLYAEGVLIMHVKPWGVDGRVDWKSIETSLERISGRPNSNWYELTCKKQFTLATNWGNQLS